MGTRDGVLWLGSQIEPKRELVAPYVGLLPLLELPWSQAEALLQDGDGVLNEAMVADVIALAISEGSDYWAGLALGWLEDGCSLSVIPLAGFQLGLAVLVNASSDAEMYRRRRQKCIVEVALSVSSEHELPSTDRRSAT